MFPPPRPGTSADYRWLAISVGIGKEVVGTLQVFLVVISQYKYSVQSVDAFSGGPGHQSRVQAPETTTN